MVKSQNKHTRIYGTSAPLQEALCGLIEDEEISPNQDIKVRG
jgi:elongation factor 2